MTVHVVRPGPPGPEDRRPDRGRLLTAAQVATELFSRTVSPAWVRRHVSYKIVLGHSTVRWYAADVRAWIEARRAGASNDSVL